MAIPLPKTNTSCFAGLTTQWDSFEVFGNGRTVIFGGRAPQQGEIIRDETIFHQEPSGPLRNPSGDVHPNPIPTAKLVPSKLRAQQLHSYSTSDARQLPLENRNFADLLKVNANCAGPRLSEYITALH